MKAYVDLLPRLEKEIDLCSEAFADIVEEWNRYRDTSVPERSADDYIGEYLGHGTLVVSIVGNEPKTALRVHFEGSDASRCALEHYNKDSYSFFPTNRDEYLACSMLDWDYYKVGIFDFVRDDTDVVTGFLWQWDVDEEPTLFTKRSAGIPPVTAKVNTSEDELGEDGEEGSRQAENAGRGVQGREGELIHVQTEALGGDNTAQRVDSEGVQEGRRPSFWLAVEASLGWRW